MITADPDGSASLSLRYNQTFAVMFVLLFFTGVTVWAFDTGFLPVPPNRWLAAVGGLTLPLLAPARIGSVLRSPLLVWVGAYLLLTVAWFVLSDPTDAALQQVQFRLFAVAFLVMALIIFSDERTHRPVRLAIAGCVLLAVALNVYDIVHPLAFSPDLGRAAGLYVNANVSGMALVLGMVIGSGVLRGWTREGFVVAAGVGVLLTQSRSAALAYVVALLLEMRSREIRATRVAALVALGVVLGTAVLWATGRLSAIVSFVSSGGIAQITRLASSSGSDSQGDFYNTQSRLHSAQQAWDIFSQKPLQGAGLGASGYTAHNMYLMLAADQGIVGLFVFPAFVFAAVWGVHQPSRRTLVALGVTLFVWGFFSHNVLDEMHTLLCAALAASMARASRNYGQEPSLPTPAEGAP